MMAEEGRSRKQHLLLALSHVSRWEGNRLEAQQISSESLHSGFTFFTHGGFPSFCSQKNKNSTFILTFSTPHNPAQYHCESSSPP